MPTRIALLSRFRSSEIGSGQLKWAKVEAKVCRPARERVSPEGRAPPGTLGHLDLPLHSGRLRGRRRGRVREPFGFSHSHQVGSRLGLASCSGFLHPTRRAQTPLPSLLTSVLCRRSFGRRQREGSPSVSRGCLRSVAAAPRLSRLAGSR